MPHCCGLRACLKRVDEILSEIHHDRHQHLKHKVNGQFKNVCLLPSSFSKRLLAENVPLTSEALQQEVLRRLQVDQARIVQVLEGHKHVLETVRVDTLESFYEEVNQRVVELIAEERNTNVTMY